ncbi:hypothetical protein PROFUN_01808 [Planoprotostelium fungivorum]|uniref:Uncharacterized protein n=1 Tax=Planoprotostelium fungivorum TaxID=1890364 RepID=A0A2P6NYT8_9EUKA|nr:hypothetical protein PROFUN_01808 [Planoprotostelium fungivorum]
MGQGISHQYHPISSLQITYRDDAGLLRRNANIQPWRMNLLGVHEGRMFVAEGDTICVYKVGDTIDLQKERELTLDDSESEVNQIRLGMLRGNIPILLAVNENATVKVFFLNDLDGRSLTYSNRYEGIEDNSTWGIAFNESRGGVPIIACSSNSHRITCWDLQNMSQERYSTALIGHHHNVPSVSFSPCGRYIASCSVDCNIRTWCIEDSSCISTAQIPAGEWGWGCKWIDEDSVYRLDVTDATWTTMGGYLQPVTSLDSSSNSFFGSFDDEVEEEEEEEEMESESEEEEAEYERLSDHSQPNEMKRDQRGLIVCTSFRNVILYDAVHLRRLCVAPRVLPGFPIIPQMDRISLLEYIPQLSLLVLASQARQHITLLRIIRKEGTEQYMLHRDADLTVRHAPIAGIHVERQVSTYHTRFFLHVLSYSGIVQSFEIQNEHWNLHPGFAAAQKSFVLSIINRGAVSPSAATLEAFCLCTITSNYLLRIMEVKLAVIGGGGVGKSAVTIRYLQNHFVEYYDPTIEDSYRKQTVIDQNSYLLDILDTAGQDEYCCLRDAYLRTGRGFLFVFSLVDRGSFEEIPVLHDQLLKAKDRDHVPLILVGNKSDLVNERAVSFFEANELARTFNCRYIETSAFSGSNVELVFQELVKCVQREEDGLVQKRKAKKTTKGFCAEFSEEFDTRKARHFIPKATYDDVSSARYSEESPFITARGLHQNHLHD